MQNNHPDEVYLLVVDFLSDELSVNKEKLSPHSRIFHDLGVDGEDGVDLLNAYSKKFNVDISDFPYSAYFGDEGTISPFGFLARLLKGRTKDNKKPLTVSDLVEGVKSQGLSRMSPST